MPCTPVVGGSVWWELWAPSGSPGGWLKHIIGVPQPWPRVSMPLDSECGMRYKFLAAPGGFGAQEAPGTGLGRRG